MTVPPQQSVVGDAEGGTATRETRAFASEREAVAPRRACHVDVGDGDSSGDGDATSAARAAQSASCTGRQRGVSAAPKLTAAGPARIASARIERTQSRPVRHSWPQSGEAGSRNRPSVAPKPWTCTIDAPRGPSLGPADSRGPLSQDLKRAQKRCGPEARYCRAFGYCKEQQAAIFARSCHVLQPGAANPGRSSTARGGRESGPIHVSDWSDRRHERERACARRAEGRGESGNGAFRGRGGRWLLRAERFEVFLHQQPYA